MTLALVGLGSNIEPRRDTIVAALAAVARLPDTRLLATSALRETAPVDCPAGSAAFINGACLLETSLAARELLRRLLAVERDLGRERHELNAPRVIDLDLLFHGDQVQREPGLTLPHPRVRTRAFALEPAADIAPDFVDPVSGRTLSALRDELREAQARGGHEAEE